MKKTFVRAASTASMLDAFESKLDEMQGGRAVDSATTLDMLDAFESKLDELQEVDTTTNVTCSVDLTEDQEDLLWDIAERYVTSSPVSGDWDTELVDEQQAIADELGVSMDDAKQLMIEQLGFSDEEWPLAASDEFESDDFDEIGDTQVIEGDVCATTYADPQGVLGDPDEQYTDEDLRAIWDRDHDSDPCITEYGDDYDSWYRDTKQWLKRVESSSYTDLDYFGKEEARLLGDLIQRELGGQTVSKRRDLAEKPGGLVYEAQRLGIEDFWQLLKALEGMCHDGRAREIDDSTYEVEPIEASTDIHASEDAQNIFMLMNYTSDAGAGMEGDDFVCVGKFFAPSLEDAIQEFDVIREQYPNTFGDVNEGSYSGSYYIEDYNDYFDNGQQTYSSINELVADLLSNSDRDLEYEAEPFE